jgi:hypothetical protein
MSNVEDRRDYGAFIPSFLDDFRLDMPSFRLYAHIARRAGSGNCWESIDKMAETCQMNRKTAYKAFKLLQDHKLILVEKRKGQTSLITLTNHCVWITIPNQVQVSPIPNQVHPYTKSGTPTYTKSGTGDIPNQVHPPIPNQVHKGTPIEGYPNKGTPIEVTPIKVKDKDEENIYAPPVEILTESIQPMQQTLIADMAEEKETPIPPTPLTSLPPENVGLAIATTEKPQKRKKSKNTLEADRLEFRPFLDVWLQDKVEDWIPHRSLSKIAVSKLKTFTREHGKGFAMEVFQKGLLFAQSDSYHKRVPKKWTIEEFLSNGKPYQYYEKYEQAPKKESAYGESIMSSDEVRKARIYAQLQQAMGVAS